MAGDRLAGGATVGSGAAVEEEADRGRGPRVPVVVSHLLAVGLAPAEIHRTPDGAALEPAAPPQHGMLAPQRDEAAGEVEQIVVDAVPVVPGDLDGLAVGVVVTALGAAGLVPAEQHRDSLREQQRGEQVALLPVPQRDDGLVVGLALDTAVPGPVVALAVGPALPVGLVVLLVVGDQVAQGKAVVGGDEADAGPRVARLGPAKVAPARHPVRDLPDRGGLAPPEIARRVPGAGVARRAQGGAGAGPRARRSRGPAARDD